MPSIRSVRHALTAVALGTAAPSFAQVDVLYESDFGPGCVVFAGEVQPLVRVAPIYPLPAIEQEIEGFVLLDVGVDESGSVERLVIVEAEPEGAFEPSATRAVRTWKYLPRIIDGEPCRFWTSTLIEYRLAR